MGALERRSGGGGRCGAKVWAVRLRVAPIALATREARLRAAAAWEGQEAAREVVPASAEQTIVLGCSPNVIDATMQPFGCAATSF